MSHESKTKLHNATWHKADEELAQFLVTYHGLVLRNDWLGGRNQPRQIWCARCDRSKPPHFVEVVIVTTEDKENLFAWGYQARVYHRDLNGTKIYATLCTACGDKYCKAAEEKGIYNLDRIG